MQIIGILLLGFIIWFGFMERNGATISAFDPHAMVMVVLGSMSAVFLSSNTATLLRTFKCLRELFPGLRFFRKETEAAELERTQLADLWREGRRSAAVELAEKSSHPAVKHMLDLFLNRAPTAVSAKVFTELKHKEIGAWQPAINNWEMLSKLGPAFGMVGTITGMIQMFKNMNANNLNIGASMSLALLATLYGVAFGAGIAGPIAHFLNGLLDERLGLIERCEMSVNEIVAREGR